MPSPAEIAQNTIIAARIIEKEQPITLMQLCRRVCCMRGEARVTPTLMRNLAEIANNRYYTCPDRKSMTIWKDKEMAESYTNYRPNSGRDIADIPMAEIKNAVAETIREQLSIDTDSLTLIAARKLGFARRGAKVDEAMALAISQLTDQGSIEKTDNKLHLAATH